MKLTKCLQDNDTCVKGSTKITHTINRFSKTVQSHGPSLDQGQSFTHSHNTMSQTMPQGLVSTE